MIVLANAWDNAVSRYEDGMPYDAAGFYFDINDFEREPFATYHGVRPRRPDDRAGELLLYDELAWRGLKYGQGCSACALVAFMNSMRLQIEARAT